MCRHCVSYGAQPLERRLHWRHAPAARCRDCRALAAHLGCAPRSDRASGLEGSLERAIATPLIEPFISCFCAGRCWRNLHLDTTCNFPAGEEFGALVSEARRRVRVHAEELLCLQDVSEAPPPAPPPVPPVQRLPRLVRRPLRRPDVLLAGGACASAGALCAVATDGGGSKRNLPAAAASGSVASMPAGGSCGV